MIYVDSSIALAHLLVEDHRPSPALWTEPLIASGQLEYEVWCRLHAHALAASHGAGARELFARVSMVEVSPLVLTRALELFPVPLRTLDALHLASIEFLRSCRLQPRLASYDERMLRAARAMGIDLLEPG